MTARTYPQPDYAIDSMTTTQLPEDHPVLKHLLKIHDSMNHCLQSDRPTFNDCLAIAESTKQRCRNLIARRKTEDATAFWDMAVRMSAWPQPDDSFHVQVEKFILDAYCSTHARKVIGDRLEKWKMTLPERHSDIVTELPVSGDKQIVGKFIKVDYAVTVAEHEVTNEEHVEDTVIEPVVYQLSAMSMSATVTPIDPADVLKSKLSETATNVIPDLGKIALKRVDSMRDNSPVFKEMHKPLHSEQTCDGIVYVYKHSEQDSMFKIGFSKSTAEGRLAQSGNCLKRNPRIQILYESSSPFFAAHKAEQLAHVALKNHRLHIQDCVNCGKGHTEWFRASEPIVLETVQAMERFVRLPAYEQNVEGEWKLTDACNGIIQPMCNMDMGTFNVCMSSHPSTPQKEHGTHQHVRQIDESTINKGTPDHEIRVAIREDGVGVPPLESTSDEVSFEQDSSLMSTGSPKPLRKRPRKVPIGTAAAATRKELARRADAVKARGTELWHQFVNTGRNPPTSAESHSMADAFADVLWSLVPQDVREAEGVSEGDVSPGKVRKTWTTRLREVVREQIEDYEREMRREDEVKPLETASAH